MAKMTRLVLLMGLVALCVASVAGIQPQVDEEKKGEVEEAAAGEPVDKVCSFH